MQWMMLLAVGSGGFVGAVMRFMLSSWVQKAAGGFFPVGTLSVNVLGSFIIGLAALYFESVVAPHQRALIITGMLGALTTFSTFSLETVAMLQSGLWGRAVANVILNALLCVVATMAGMLLFRRLYG